jgi:hypothetical protein
LATFDFLKLRFHVAAKRRIVFPAEAAANVLRSGFGAVLKNIACAADCVDARVCSRREDCAYARLFAPKSADGPSGLRDLPRPFVFRASHLNNVTINSGDRFYFDVNLFETSDASVDLFERAFAERFGTVEQVDGREAVRLCLAPRLERIDKIRVRFLTPTELKGTDRPEFGGLFARIRDRISTVRALYGDGPLDIDFKAMGERAALVRMTRCEIRQVEAERTSKNTGQRHSLGGFVGEADYEGDLAEFAPYLEIARWTGVGRQTVWGKGEIGWETY